MINDKQDVELELFDDDIIYAMRQFGSFVDMFIDDFRVIYHCAHQHAVQRLTQGLTASALMRRNVPTLSPDTMLDVAVRSIAHSGYKGLPVVATNGEVIGMLTETDLLRRFHVDTFLELLLKMMENHFMFDHICHETPVREAMTASAVSVRIDAGFREIFRSFRLHEGRSMPVIDAAGRIQGLLLRKDFLIASHLEKLL